VVIQRVASAAVDMDDQRVAAIEKGILALVGVEKGDGEKEARFLANKVSNMRIFEDENGRMNLSVIDIGAQLLAVPQFTLAADLRKGRRPSFDTAAEPDRARELFELFADSVAAEGIEVARGSFQEHMHVSLVNDGPVTFVLRDPLP
jgi:D-tyrosyl-tRNA(Tyr) deacylase